MVTLPLRSSSLATMDPPLTPGWRAKGLPFAGDGGKASATRHYRGDRQSPPPALVLEAVPSAPSAAVAALELLARAAWTRVIAPDLGAAEARVERGEGVERRDRLVE